MRWYPSLSGFLISRRVDLCTRFQSMHWNCVLNYLTVYHPIHLIACYPLSLHHMRISLNYTALLLTILAIYHFFPGRIGSAFVLRGTRSVPRLTSAPWKQSFLMTKTLTTISRVRNSHRVWQSILNLASIWLSNLPTWISSQISPGR